MTSNERKGMLTIMDDTTAGVHDTLIAACDCWWCEELVGEEGHRSCVKNAVKALSELGKYRFCYILVPLYHI